MTEDSNALPGKRRRLERVTAACDLCKKRKVKCDGTQPCAYCKKKDRASTCTFTAPKERGHVDATLSPDIRTRENSQPAHDGASGSHENAPAAGALDPSSSPTVSRDDHQDDTIVPREGRILRDAQGKFIFIGDCAPLSFLQTVRHLITSEVDSAGFAISASRDSLIEIAPTETVDAHEPLSINSRDAECFVTEYAVVTSGLVELFLYDEFLEAMKIWLGDLPLRADDAGAAVFLLVLAIGAQESHENKSMNWFHHARDLLMKYMCNSMNVATVQGFTLVAVYMLRSFQPNGAYLYFSLAARTAYAIGIHRTEVNDSFGAPMRMKRDRIWKSLRVIDMLISNVLGRPPSTSDVDCTVKYNGTKTNHEAHPNILDASVQIFMIIERVVVEVYSRKRISLRIADYVSRQLKGWASKWLRALTAIAAQSSGGAASRSTVVGACSTLCSYYYGIMLLTRPFLIYEIYEHLGASLKDGGSLSDHRNKRKYADAAIDVAASFVDTLQAVIHADVMPRCMPLIVPWLFTTALVLAVGILGRSGLVFEESCNASVRCLEYFGQSDPHARQYSVIVQSLLEITTAHVKKRENSMRRQRKQASSELFGLLASLPTTPSREAFDTSHRDRLARSARPDDPPMDATSGIAPFDWTMYDADFFALPWPSENDQSLQDFLQPGPYNVDGATVADIPLFPIYDQQLGGRFNS